MSGIGQRPAAARALRVAGLFAGVGGIELGLQRAGHGARLLCEVDPACQAVLDERFGLQVHGDIRELDSLPRGTELVTAGFPCQDLSQAGMTEGIAGARSGLVGEVFRLLEKHQVPRVLIENVPFMLQLGRGKAMEVITTHLERLGYRWAYRIVNTRAFGLPQRRRRVFLLASLAEDPRTVLFADDAGGPQPCASHADVACGFYWTEGLRGLGWAVNSVPTLKGGSTVGIPSPPAIVLPSSEVYTPDIRDAERLQGFEADWTRPAESAGRASGRWKLVGNAVSVPAATWIGERLARPGKVLPFKVEPLRLGRTWPSAAWNCDGPRLAVSCSEWPERRAAPDLLDFLEFPMVPLSRKATAGFLSRTKRSTLRFPDGFIDKLRQHLSRMECEHGNYRLFHPRPTYRVAVV